MYITYVDFNHFVQFVYNLMQQIVSIIQVCIPKHLEYGCIYICHMYVLVI